ncbi:MAG TPA: aminotransferase class V-fold PLP-dependent enzyme [Gemmatimonadales bacterium]|nr:aminotransferase class V-fold PLP-dependent enzyme [Gemmatimonadales bacterium]
MTYRSGRHFLQIPGPTNVPDRVLRAMDRPTIDHRGPAFAELAREVLSGLKEVFGTQGHVVVYPASGSGAWEAALVNTLSPGDKILAFDHGFFAVGWARVAARMGLEVDLVPLDWRRGADPAVLEEKLAADRERAIKAVLVVHNETSTGVTSNVSAVRHVLDGLRHPALLMVDAVSSLASMDYRHDEWQVDVTVAGSQKGLMLPPGLSFNAISDKAWRAHGTAKLPRSYWSWDDMLEFNASGFFPYTPATNLLFGLREALRMLREEGLPHVFARHRRLADATRRAVAAWGLDVLARDPGERSDTVTAVLLPDGHDAEAVRRVALERFDLSLGAGLGKLKGRVFRVGHLGDFNELMLAGALCGVEMALRVTGVPLARSGVTAALDVLRAPAD